MLARRVLFLCMVAVTIVGCSSAPAADEPGPTPTTTAAGYPPPPPPEEWQSVADPGTGVSFVLPGTVREDSRSDSVQGVPRDVRLYGTEVDTDFGVSVSITESPAADYSAAGLDFVLDETVAALDQGGGVAVEVTDRVASVVDGRPVLDYRLTFTRPDGKTMYQVVRLIGSGTWVVSALCMALTAGSVDEDVMVAYHDQLVERIRLP